jgi:hypothetical protein
VFPVRYKLCILPTECICVFRMVLTINRACFPNNISLLVVVTETEIFLCEVETEFVCPV